MEIKVNKLLQDLEELVVDKKEVMFTKNVMVSKEEFRTILEELRHELPDSISQASVVYEERDKIRNDAIRRAEEVVQEAEKNADIIIANAEEKARQLIDSHTITERALQEKEEIIEKATLAGQEKLRIASEDCSRMVDDTHDFVEEKITALEKTIAKARIDTDSMREDFIKRIDDLYYTLENSFSVQHDRVLKNRDAFHEFRESLIRVKNHSEEIIRSTVYEEDVKAHEEEVVEEAVAEESENFNGDAE